MATPVPRITPYISPSQGGNANVPVGQTGIPYSKDFIGPIPYNYGAVGQPVSTAQIYNPAPTQQPSQPQQQSGGAISEADALSRGWDVNNLPSGYSIYRPGKSESELAADRVRGDIESGYNSYFSQLDQMLGSIPTQQAGQEQIVNNNYTQGVSDINAQRASSLGDLETSRRKNEEQQVRGLQDIADNIRNLFKTGNVMLGTRGAGDSSAADQYSYAVTQLGSKQRGDVMTQTRSIQNDIADREAKLNNIVTQETQKLKTERDNAVLQIAQYFQDAQNQILQAKATGQLQKGQSLAQLSTQLLQTAQQQLMQADANFKNRENALMQWAVNNSTNINQLKTNLAAVGQYNVPGVSAPAINGTPQFDAQGNLTTPFYGGGGGTNEKQQSPLSLNNLGNSIYSLNA